MCVPGFKGRTIKAAVEDVCHAVTDSALPVAVQDVFDQLSIYLDAVIDEISSSDDNNTHPKAHNEGTLSNEKDATDFQLIDDDGINTGPTRQLAITSLCTGLKMISTILEKSQMSVPQILRSFTSTATMALRKL